MSALTITTSAALPLARTSEGMKSGPWGLAMILLLCVAVYFLWRSMNKHLRKARTHFEAEAQSRRGTTQAAPPPSGAAPTPPGGEGRNPVPPSES
jgi:hypothetical protein